MMNTTYTKYRAEDYSFSINDNLYYDFKEKVWYKPESREYVSEDEKDVPY